jgi:hypothetical protein
MELAAGIAWTGIAIGALAMLGVLLLATGLAAFVHTARRSRAIAHTKEDQR